MDFYQAQEFFKSMFPGKQITYEFDDKCHRFYEIVMTSGDPNMVHHVENDRVKVFVEGQDPMYVPISPHRETYTWAALRAKIDCKSDVHFTDAELDSLIKANESSGFNMQDCLQELSSASGLTTEQIQSKINAFKASASKPQSN